LPADSKAPELDDSNAAKALTADAAWTGEDLSGGSGVTVDTVGVYLAYLIEVGFMPPPTSSSSKTLPEIKLSLGQREEILKVGGRGGAS
jgi:L-aminoadipate-semialdehyde dehydrogenase